MCVWSDIGYSSQEVFLGWSLLLIRFSVISGINMLVSTRPSLHAAACSQQSRLCTWPTILSTKLVAVICSTRLLPHGLMEHSQMWMLSRQSYRPFCRTTSTLTGRSSVLRDVKSCTDHMASFRTKQVRPLVWCMQHRHPVLSVHCLCVDDGPGQCCVTEHVAHNRLQLQHLMIGVHACKCASGVPPVPPVPSRYLPLGMQMVGYKWMESPLFQTHARV